jgi:hypothetical protein
LEDFHVQFDDMGSNISGNKFMIFVLSDLATDYDLQLKPLTVQDHIRAQSSLCFERLSETAYKKGRNLDSKHCFAINPRENAEMG